MITLADMEGNETYDPSMLGHAEEARRNLACTSPRSRMYLPCTSPASPPHLIPTLILILTLAPSRAPRSSRSGSPHISLYLPISPHQVIEERICDDDHLVIKGGKTQRSCCCLLRGANMHMLDEVERSLHDALCAVKRTMESASVVPGGGR